jgi:uncharacterized integral membrane protein
MLASGGSGRSSRARADPSPEEAAMSVRGPNDGDPLEFLTEPTVSQERTRADAEHLKRLRKVRQQRLVRAGLVVALLVVLIVFVLQNSQPVPVKLLVLEGNPRLIWVIVLCAAIGGVVGYLLGKPPKADPGGKGRSRKR